MACVWLDRRSVYFLSITHVPFFCNGNMGTVKRMDGNEKIDILSRPMLPDYIENMRVLTRRIS